MERGEVTAITSRRGSKRREVHVGGEYWDTMPSDVVKALELHVGETIALDTVRTRRREVEPRHARERAFRLLAYRERSRAEMSTRLTDDGYLPDVVAETVGWLTDTGLLDDERFAEQMARSLVSLRGFGRQRALRELRRFGIDDDMAVRALDALAPPEGEDARALETASRLVRPSDTVDRLAARLVRRGFSIANALKAARAYTSADGDPEPDQSC